MGKLKEALSGNYRGKTLKDKVIAYANSGKFHARLEKTEPEEIVTGGKMSFQDWNDYYLYLDGEDEKNGVLNKKQTEKEIEKKIEIMDQKQIAGYIWLMSTDFYLELDKAIKKSNSLIVIINEQRAVIEELELQLSSEDIGPEDIEHCAWLEHRIAYHKKLIIVFQKHAGFLERKVIVEKC